MGGRDYLYNMMNLSSNESYIDFEFEAGEVEYRSIVKLKRNSKNFENVTTPKRELYKKENGEWVALDLKDDANKMENIIGLSYENFRKVIIIPQGAFKDFLEMSSGDRTEMFSKIFPELKRYDLSAKAGSLLSETREKRTFITGQLEQLSAVSEEEVEQETIKLNQLSDALKVNGQQLEKCKQQTLKMDRLKGLVDRYMVCVAEQQKLEADKEVITKMTEQLKEYNECVHIFGEDIIEINSHGGIATTNRVLELLLVNGCRLAEPGEFTKRAFLNGRIDLSKAEAIMDIIHADNEFALQVGMKQLKGSVSKKVSFIREQLIYEIAFIESALDDPEHISLDNYNEKLLPIIENIETELSILLKNADNGKVLTEGIKTVIVGKPNAGKSSLLNLLLLILSHSFIKLLINLIYFLYL